MDIPTSSVAGIFWPAIPHPANAAVFALLYQLDQSQWWEPQQRSAFQMRQLSILLTHCRNHIPFYRDRLKGIVNPARPISMESFRQIPLLSRLDIQEFGEQLSSPVIPPSHQPRGEGRTSGSTGRSIGFEYTHITGLFYRALNLRFHLWHKQDFTGKLAAIRMPRIKNNDGRTGSARAWISTYKSGRFVELSAQTPINEQIQWLQKEQPAFLLTYPSNLLALVKFCEQAGIGPPGIREIDTTGEVCTDEVRNTCESVWGIQPRDIYSCMENGILALQCPDHRCYHVQSDSVIVEILDNNDQPCQPGQVGRVVVTDLHNFAMPFIRYEIGDYAEPGPPCPCGRTLPVLNRIQGRTRNMLVLPSGDQVWPILPLSVWSALAPIRQIQVIQHDLKDIEIKAALSGPIQEEQLTTLKREVSVFFDDAFAIRLTVCDEIERSASGKFEDFKSLLNQASGNSAK